MAAELMPRDWVWTQPTTPVGNFWPGYYRCYLPKDGLVSLAGGEGQVRMTFDTARLGDGYSTGVKTRIAAATHNAVGDLHMSGWLWWPNELTSSIGTVHYTTAHFQNSVVGANWPSARQYHTGGAGVIARASSWSYATDSVGGITHTHCLNGTCYWFGVVQEHTGGDTNAMFALLKFTGSGAYSALTTSQTSGSWTDYIGLPWQPHAFRIITVDLSGTSTRINCQVGVWSDAQGDFIWTTIFQNYTDSSSPLQGTTRSGFTLSGDSQLGVSGSGSTGVAVVPGCTSFQLAEGNTGQNLIAADNFRRRAPAQGQGIPVSLSASYFYAVGPYEAYHFDLCSAFSGDEFSAEGNLLPAQSDWHHITNNTLGGGAVLGAYGSWNDPWNYESMPPTGYPYSNGDPGITHGYVIHQWAAEKSWTQHRRVTLMFTRYAKGPIVATEYSGNERRWFGLVVRSTGASLTNPNVNGELNTRYWPGEGYDVLLGCNEGSAFPQGQVRVYRRIDTGAKAYQLLAYANVTVTRDSLYDLAAECYTQTTAGGSPTGNVIVRVYFGATPNANFVTLTKAASCPAGIDVTGGAVVDGTSDRIVGGYGEGLRAFAPYGSQKPCTMWRDWKQLDLQTGGASGGVNENDQVAWPVSTETDGSTGTFSTPYEFAVLSEHHAAIRKLAYESGHTYVNKMYLDSRRIWKIGGTINDAELTVLKNFWTTHDGGVVGFDFENPDSSGDLIKAHFVAESLRYELVELNMWEYSLEIEELFDQ